VGILKTPTEILRRVLRVLTPIIIVYVLVCLAVALFQRKLLYLPTRMPAGIITQVAAEGGLLPWTNSQGLIIGWRIPAHGEEQGSVLIVHGTAGCAATRDYLAKPIHDAEPVDVYVLEYPGYGAREGKPSQESLDAAAEEAFRLLPAKLPRYIVSESLGTGVAGDLAANHPEAIAGMALIAPYHDLASVAQRRFWFLPAYFFLRDRFNPAQSLKNYHGPINFVIAGADEIIGPESGRRLFEEYGGPKNLEEVPGAHHNDIAAQSPEWWRETFAFWAKRRS
jgi:pimeloyl-ACP methyl ester carboxylesterase